MLTWLRKRLLVPGREDGSAIMVFMVVFLIPVTFILFGAGVDVAIANYTKTNLQNQLDSATQSAISSARNTNTYTTPRLSQENARLNFIAQYEANIGNSGLAWLKCQGNTGVGGGCPFDLTYYQPKINSAGQVTGMTVRVHQESTPFFLVAFNIVPEWQYNLESTATQTRACVGSGC